MKALIREFPGVWGPLIAAGCPRCDWHGRKRARGGNRHMSRRDILRLAEYESLNHQIENTIEGPGNAHR